FKPMLAGNDVRFYSVKWNGEHWISYGSWLGAARNNKFFTSKRIIVKQIIDWTTKRIWAALTDEELYNTQNAFVLIAKKGFIPEYLIALINSKLISYYHTKTFTDEFKLRFQKILIKDAKKFPIRNIKEIEQKPFKSFVNQILAAKKESPKADTSSFENEIDKLVYQLYNLTPEEIQTIESSIK
ncbi:MAG: TaqI-like C-terminal specificity domain-containing protein, partial [Chitinophagaceae bacterium]